MFQTTMSGRIVQFVAAPLVGLFGSCWNEETRTEAFLWKLICTTTFVDKLAAVGTTA